MIKVTAVGGGTGSYTVLSGLKKYPIDLKAIVCATDTGGSTGRLRDEFGYLPVGDFRMALVALSPEEDANNLLRKLLMYRFDKGKDLKGHNFGNILLTALTELLGSQEEALTAAGKILNIKGSVIPITTQETDLVALYSDGSKLEGEGTIDEPPNTHNPKLKIKKLYTKRQVSINHVASEALKNADFIILGPGDLYTSVFANLVVQGAKEALIKSSAQKIFIINLVTKSGQTSGFKASNFLSEYKKYAGTYPNYVLVNNAELPTKTVQKYQENNEFPVLDDLMLSSLSRAKIKLVRTDLLAEEEVHKPSGDILKRSYLRHDPEKLSKALMKIFLS